MKGKKNSMRMDTKIPGYPHKKNEFASYTPRAMSPTGRTKATANKRAKKRMAY